MFFKKGLYGCEACVHQNKSGESSGKVHINYIGNSFIFSCWTSHTKETFFFIQWIQNF